MNRELVVPWSIEPIYFFSFIAAPLLLVIFENFKNLFITELLAYFITALDSCQENVIINSQ